MIPADGGVSNSFLGRRIAPCAMGEQSGTLADRATDEMYYKRAAPAGTVLDYRSSCCDARHYLQANADYSSSHFLGPRRRAQQGSPGSLFHRRTVVLEAIRHHLTRTRTGTAGTACKASRNSSAGAKRISTVAPLQMLRAPVGGCSALVLKQSDHRGDFRWSARPARWPRQSGGPSGRARST